MSIRAIGLAAGVAFGFVLGWARLTDYDVIRAMLLLREPDVFLLMMSAMLTAAVGLHLLRAFKVRSVLDREPIAWTMQTPGRKHVVGSIVFGIGWSLAGTCPGPVAAQLGRGQLVALFTIGGVLTGVLIHDRLRLRSASTMAGARAREAGAVAGL